MAIKIVAFFAVHRRLEILKICLQGLQRLQDYAPERFEIISFAVCSEKDESDVLSNFGVQHVIYPNDRLGEKKNMGLRAALKLEWDYLMELGSDDLLQNSLLDLYESRFKEGKMAWGINTCYFYEVGTHKIGLHENHYPIGAGRCFKREVFTDIIRNRVKFKSSRPAVSPSLVYRKDHIYDMRRDNAEAMQRVGLGVIIGNPNDVEFWDADRQRALDGNSMMKLATLGLLIETIETKEPYVLDVKSEQNINPINIFPEIDYPILNYFKDEADAIRRLG